MTEQLSTENYIRKSTSKQFSTRGRILNTYLIFASLCAIAALIVSAISLHRANGAVSFQSSTFTHDIERTFNSTVYALEGDGTQEVDCSDLNVGAVTGQTSIPGQCITVGESYNMWVTRLAENCSPLVYAEASCTGSNRSITDSGLNLQLPYCVHAAGAGKLAGYENSTYRSFQIVCI